MKRSIGRKSKIRNHYYRHYVTKEPSKETEKEPSKETEKQPILDTTLLIGLLTVLGYFVAFSYEKGYKSYFHLNEVLLDEITLFNVLVAMTAITSVWTTLYIIYQLWKHQIIAEKPQTTFGIIIYKLVLFPTMIGYIIYSISPKSIEYLVLSIFVASVFIFYNFFQPTSRKEQGYINKLMASINEDYQGTFLLRTIIVIQKNKFAIVYLLIPIFVLSAIFGRLLGEGSASRQENYLIITGPIPYVVIDNNKDNLIIAPIDLKTKTFIPKFQIIESKSDMKEPLVFETMNFEGGLKVKNQEVLEEKHKETVKE